MFKRALPKKPATRKVKVSFNGETLSAYYAVTDSRTSDEKWLNQKNGRLSGPVIVFFQGHAQRPADIFPFTAELSFRCTSGVVISPVCDTPYGADKKWRGDAGKTVILMEVVRHALQELGVDFAAYAPRCDLPIALDGRIATPGVRALNAVSAGAAALGWSHGCSLARRFASAYPSLVTDFAQMCPSGYVNWGNMALAGPARLLVRFLTECLNISMRATFSHPVKATLSGLNVMKGNTIDTINAVSSLIDGNKHPMKLLRNMRDLKECAIYLDSYDAPMAHVKNAVIIFGEHDSLFNLMKISGVKRRSEIGQKEIDRFWATYYPDIDVDSSNVRVMVADGDHIAPYVHHTLYPELVLKGLGLYHDENATPVRPAVVTRRPRVKRSRQMTRKTA